MVCSIADQYICPEQYRVQDLHARVLSDRGSQTVRRLACTLRDKDTGQYRGTQVLDDSRGKGVTEYLPPND